VPVQPPNLATGNIAAQPAAIPPAGAQPAAATAPPSFPLPSATTQLPVPGVAQLPVPGAPQPGLPVPGQPAAAAAFATATNLAPTPVNPALNPEDIIPAGTIAVQGMALDQFLELYGQYSGRTILRPYALPAPAGFTLKSETDLTRREVIEAMDAVFALNNITMIPIGEKFVKSVPSNMATKKVWPLPPPAPRNCPWPSSSSPWS
jgi:general secretion pathway protein D